VNALRTDDEALRAAVAAAGLDTVAGAFAFTGGTDLNKPGLGRRRRTRLTLTDATGRTHELYLKRYGPEPSGRGPHPAETEADNITAVRAAGVATMQVVAAGAEPLDDGTRRGYLLATAVGGDALERCFEDFLRRRDAAAAAAITEQLAEMVRRLHAAGLCHRDLYASHVFLEAGGGAVRLWLIDLARVFRPRWRRRRWRVKDLAQLKYSMPPAWTQAHWGAFLAAYLGPDATVQAPAWNRRIDRKVGAMRRRQEQRSRRT